MKTVFDTLVDIVLLLWIIASYSVAPLVCLACLKYLSTH